MVTKSTKELCFTNSISNQPTNKDTVPRSIKINQANNSLPIEEKLHSNIYGSGMDYEIDIIYHSNL